jgi:hypothetical protein
MLAFLCLLSVAADNVERFEGKPNEAFATPAVGKPNYSAEVPAAFTYDPLSRKSMPNASSLKFDGGIKKPHVVRLPGNVGSDGFTLEGFFKPAVIAGESGQRYTIFAKTAKTPTAANLRFEAFRSYPGHVYTWLQARISAPKFEHEITNNRYGGMAMLGEKNPWRHAAIVVDPKKNRVEFWLDYTLQNTEKLPEAGFDDGPIFIGGEPDGNGFAGLIDEVRLSPRPLAPAHFLHASANAIADVDLSAKETVLPRGAGAMDGRERFTAVGDGTTDDTAAIQKAFRDLADTTHLVGSQTLVLPAGTYLIHDTVRFSRYLTVIGAGPGKTILKLADNAKLFQDPSKPRPVLSTGFAEYAENIRSRQGGNVTHAVYVFGLTVDTGKGNPGAIGFDYQGHNNSRVADLEIRSGDGQGVCGIDLLRPWPGPCLLRDIRIVGFDHAMISEHSEYSFTLSRVQFEGQSKGGLLVRYGQAVAIERQRPGDHGQERRSGRSRRQSTRRHGRAGDPGG